MNILITSIGQRGYLIDHFKSSSKGKYGIFAADATKYAPGLQNADKAFVIPYANDPTYFDRLLTICLKNDVKCILSINDLELPVLATYKDDFANHGIFVIISNKEVIDVCYDKFSTYKYCLEVGIPVPKTYLWSEYNFILSDLENGLIRFPLITKPRKGSRSVGIFLIENKEQLEKDKNRQENLNISEDQKHIYQEYIDSDQFSLHVFNDEELKPIQVVSMVNIFRKFGETFHIKTIRNATLLKLGYQIGLKLGHYGPLSVDVHKKENGEFVVLEFNPRISGCYSLSHFAGADFPTKIFNLIEGVKILEYDPFKFTEDLIMLKQFTTDFYTVDELNQKVNNMADIVDSN